MSYIQDSRSGRGLEGWKRSHTPTVSLHSPGGPRWDNAGQVIGQMTLSTEGTARLEEEAIHDAHLSDEAFCFIGTLAGVVNPQLSPKQSLWLRQLAKY